MPHINIKHFPLPLKDSKKLELVNKIVSVIKETFLCSDDVISISLEPKEQEDWMEQVYKEEIVNRKELLIKEPNY